MDIKKYLMRIGYNGPLDATSSTLHKLMDCHIRTVPFDTFNLIGGPRKTLSLTKMYDDIVVKKQGGLCYETNALFCWLLRELGFGTDFMISHYFMHFQQEYCTVLNHMCLMVTCCDATKWVVDVGAGFRTYSSPLKFVEMETQVLKSGVYRIRKKDDEDFTYIIEKVPKLVRKGLNQRHGPTQQKSWENVYKFTLTPREMEDFEPMCSVVQDGVFDFFINNTISCLSAEDGIALTWGYQYCKKKYIDPYTEEVIEVVVTKTENNFKKLLKEKWGLVLNFPLDLKAKNFIGFTDDKELLPEQA